MNCFLKTGENTVRLKQEKRKNWISSVTWNLIQQKKPPKINLTWLFYLKCALNHHVTIVNSIGRLKEVHGQRGKRKWIADLAKGAQAATEAHNSKELYAVARKDGRNILKNFFHGRKFPIYLSKSHRLS